MLLNELLESVSDAMVIQIYKDGNYIEYDNKGMIPVKYGNCKVSDIFTSCRMYGKDRAYGILCIEVEGYEFDLNEYITERKKKKENNMTLKEFLDLYDNWNGTLVINDRNCDLYARVKFINIMKWFTEHKGIAISNVMAFGFYDNELCVRIAYGEQKGE